MSDAVVILDKWPLQDTAAGAQVMAQVLGGVPMDHARTLMTCRGVVADGIPQPQAKQLEKGLTRAGAAAIAAPSKLVPELPHVLHASRIDPRYSDGLHVQVALTGPPEVLPWDRIVLVLPAMWQESKTVRKGPAPKKPGMMKKAASMGPAGMVMKAVNSGRPQTGQSTEVDTSLRPMMMVVCANPLVRVHAFADRLDYQVLGEQMEQGIANFQTLLGILRQRTRADLPSRGALDRYLANRPLPEWLHVADNAALGRTARWLFLRGEIRRKLHGTAAPKDNFRTTFTAGADLQAQLQAALKSGLSATSAPQAAPRAPAPAPAPQAPSHASASPPSAAELWERHGQTFPAGSVIFEAGENSREMYVIQSGQVQVSIWDDGQERVVAKLGPPDFFGEMAVLNGQPRSATCSTVSETRMLVFDPQSLANLVRGNPDVAIKMIKKMAQRLQTANDRIAQLLVQDPVERVLGYLAEVAARDGFDRGNQVSLQITSNDIVAHIGLPLGTVEKVLDALQSERKIVRRERVIITPKAAQLKAMILQRKRDR